MIAIKVTNKIKRQNDHLDWVVNAKTGDIVKMNDSRIPNRFHVNEPVDGGYGSRTDLHAGDGWRPFIKTQYDATTHKETNEIIGIPENVSVANTTHYTFKIVEMSPEEQDQTADEGEENEAEFKLDEHVENGEELFRKCYKKIWRRRHKDRDAKNKLTQSEERDLMEWFAPVFIWLKLGNFHQAKREINQVINNNTTELNAVPGMINTAEWLQTEILNYFDNIYDL